MEPACLPQVSLDARMFRYGDLPSLYHTLDHQIIVRLEEAILCCCLRDFNSAVAVFDSFSVELRHHPVIAYQHSQAYWMQWSHFKGAEILQEALSAAEKSRADIQDPGVFTLLRLCYATAKYCTEGNLTLARDAMKETRSWLSDVPMQEYTDIQVNMRNLYTSRTGLAS